MVATLLSSMTLLATLHTHSASLTTQPPVTTRAPMVASTARVSAARADAEHLARAKRAMLDGQFELARREFSAAATLEREAGRVPVEAVTGLAHALYSQSYNVEAALAMERLAEEAAANGDANAQALALADAIWLHSDAGQRVTARKHAARLKKLMKDSTITADTREFVRVRVG
jgi:hypothetical protein